MDYFSAVGPTVLVFLVIALTGISLFQNLCTLWIAYWTADNKSETFVYNALLWLGIQPPLQSVQLLIIYGCGVACFTVSNFAGHSLEIIGGIGAARAIFAEALTATLSRPFSWWDSNPTGRVLNRFSQDVEIMDNAVTNIMGVIFGAVLYFIGHTVVLGISNPFSLCLLPFIGFGLEYYASFYRLSVREVKRIWLVSMSTIYQDMAEAIMGNVTVRAFSASKHVLCSSMVGLERLQRIDFAKTTLELWVRLRMALVSYGLNVFNQCYPVLQFYGLLHPQSAALVGFSIEYSQMIVNIISQFVLNYSDLEMQLVSIERLREYTPEQEAPPVAMGGIAEGAKCLELVDVEVTYREGIRPALSGVTINFAQREAAAIVGRTGAGKSSLLLSVLQLVPYTGKIQVAGEDLSTLLPADVRFRLVGVVPQTPVVFAGDLRWNLDPEGTSTDEEVVDVLRAVGLQPTRQDGRLALASTSGGPAGDAEGLSLSQGQRQLLCAARVLLRHPRVVMLDEVSASLPADASVDIVSSLIRKFKDDDAAVLLVTHQEELIPCCERVVTLACGRVVDDCRK